MSPLIGARPSGGTTECRTGAGLAKASKVDPNITLVSSVPASAPSAPSDKALVFFFWQGSNMRSWKGAHVRLAIDGEWKALVPAKNTYMWFEADPGSLELCNFGGAGLPENHGHMTLSVQAGQTYFVEGSPGGDLIGQLRAAVRSVPESEGRPAIAKPSWF